MDLTALYSMAEKLEISYVTAVVITGLSVVFLGLVILILFVWAFGKIFTSRNKPTPNEKVPAPKVTAPAPVTAPVNVSNDSEDEIIAVISAAVASMGQADGKNYRVKSVKAVKNRPSRSARSLAGVQNDTMPF